MVCTRLDYGLYQVRLDYGLYQVRLWFLNLGVATPLGVA